MSALALTFNGVNLSPISHKNQTWLTSVELAKSLGYADEKSVSRIFTRNKDEFSGNMTTLFQGGQIDHLGESCGVQNGTRIFSLRGCHLIAMFAKTVIAKQFRVWVLDILDKEVNPKRNGLVELPPAYLTPAMKKHINRQVSFLAKTQIGTTHSVLGKSIQDKFNVNKREFILASKYTEVCEFLGCEPDPKALQGELLEPAKVEYQPPAGMMLVSVEDFEKLKQQQIFPKNYYQFIDVVNELEDANYRIFKKDALVALHEMLTKMI